MFAKIWLWVKQHKKQAVFDCLLSVLVIWAVVGIFLPLGVTSVEIASPDLPPAFDGFTILQISDLQGSMNERILEYAQQLQPDIIVFTGDNLYNKKSEGYLEWTLQLVRDLREVAPIYAVSGNHDLWNKNFKSNQRLLSEAGVIHLENTFATIEKENDAIHIMGVTDPNTLDHDRSQKTIKRYLEQVPATSGYDVLLFHRAGNLDELMGRGFELVLSGHNHGGQVRIPFLGGVMTPDMQLFPKYTEGMHQIDETTTAVISRGIGNTVSIPRIHNPPELVFITLKA